MPDTVTLTIDGQAVTAPAGSTILKAAQSAGIAIPTICYHDFCTANGLCRICVVEVEGARTLAPACVAQVAEGMKIHTQSERVRRARRAILEMLAATVDLSDAPEILQMLRDYAAGTAAAAGTTAGAGTAAGAEAAPFPLAERRAPPVIDDNPMYIRDYAKCILCWRCVQVCAADAQFTYALNFEHRGFETQIATFFHHPMLETTCVFCGQCVGVCPTGALKPRRQWLIEQGHPPDEEAAFAPRWPTRHAQTR